METFTIEYIERDTTPDRIRAMAAFHGVTPEMVISRAVNEYLGERFLPEPPPEDFEAKSLDELFVAHGFRKSNR